MHAQLIRRSRTGWGGAFLAAGLLAAAVALLAVYRHRSSGSSHPVEQASQSDYVDGAVCAGCHQDVAETYRKTGMGRSFSLPAAAGMAADFIHANSILHQPSGLRYTMVQREGEFFERRSEAGFDGKETNVMEERIDYVIGSGNHARTFLHRAPGGQLIELPVSWYSEGSGYWAMSPGYDWKGQKDFGRAITGECMFCHNGYPEGDAGLERSIFPQALPHGIDCQRCHGPGRAHVEAARSGHAASEQLQSTIVNPARLGRERQLEVCMQCHLETTSHEPNDQRNFDRSTFSYRPGQPLADFKLYVQPIDHDAHPGAGANDSFEIAHAAYRLRMSACFEEQSDDLPDLPRSARHSPRPGGCRALHRGMSELPSWH